MTLPASGGRQRLERILEMKKIRRDVTEVMILP